MSKYSIKELEKLSGIKAHTIRIWEKRYEIISPGRTPSNIRSYSNEDLRKILKFAVLKNEGYKISKIAALSSYELDMIVREISRTKSDYDVNIDMLILSMIDFDEVRFEQLLSENLEALGFECTLLDVIYPFLEKIGILWLSDNISPIQEHFISNLVRQKLIVAIDALPVSRNPLARKVVLFLPEHELHEIGLLFCHYLLRSSGYYTIYLGQYVPLEDLEITVNQIKPHYLVSIISNRSSDIDVVELITLISNKFPKTKLYLSGQPVIDADIHLPENVHIFKSARELKKIFNVRAG